jgi:hypothetical protein
MRIRDGSGFGGVGGNGRKGAGAELRVVDPLVRGEVIASRHLVDSLWRAHPLGELYACRDLGRSSDPDRDQGPPVLVHRLRREFAGARTRAMLAEGLALGAGFGVGSGPIASPGLDVARSSAAIPELLDAGVDFDGRPFVVMPMTAALARAQTLADLARPLGFGFADALALIEQIATVLAPAHAARRVHGGLEPASVVVELGRGLPKLVALLGFGLVPSLDGSAKGRKLPLLMTPTHVAPELVQGEPMTPAADVYALGIILWELIYGAPPFRGPTLRILDAHLHRALPERELPNDVPPAFAWVLRRMLAKNPVDRFPDASSVAAQLRPFAVEAVPDLSFEIDHELSGPLPAASRSASGASRIASGASRVASPSGAGVTSEVEDEDEATCVFERVIAEDPREARRDPDAPERPSARVRVHPDRSAMLEPWVDDGLPVSEDRERPRAKGRLGPKQIALATLAVVVVLLAIQTVIEWRLASEADTGAREVELLPPR